jgi:hypothetical protein
MTYRLKYTLPLDKSNKKSDKKRKYTVRVSKRVEIAEYL